jgi:hypothetical protein
MTDDPTQEVKNLATDTIKSRLNHPIIGTLIFSFLIWNWDKILILVLNVKSDPSAIEQFKDTLCKNFGLGYLIPIAMTILIPFFIEPWLNSRLQIRLAESQRKTKNRIEQEENETNSIAFEKIKKELEKLNFDYKNLMNSYKENIKLILIELPIILRQDYVYFIFKSENTLNKDIYVSLPDYGEKIIPYDSSHPMVGQVECILGNKCYLIKSNENRITEKIRHLEQTNSQYVVYYINNQTNTIEASLTTENIDQRFFIKTNNRTSRPNFMFSHVREGFREKYIKDIHLYLK